MLGIRMTAGKSVCSQHGITPQKARFLLYPEGAVGATVLPHP